MNEALENFDHLINTLAVKFNDEFSRIWNNGGFEKYARADLDGDYAKRDAILSELRIQGENKYRKLMDRGDAEQKRAMTAAGAADSAYAMRDEYASNAKRAAAKEEDIKRRRTK